MSEFAGKTIGGYPIERSLGVNGFVELLEARTSAAPLNIRVLREDLRGDSELVRHVLKSWDAVRAVQHPNLRVVYSVGNEATAGVFGLEEPIAGSPIRESVLSGAKIAWRDCSIIAEQLFGALRALHKAGFVHGCVWTGDILMTQDQDLKLSGAGLLSKIERQMLQVVPGPAAGYLAPEALSGSPPTVENDIYGAGACLYFILSGRDPFPGEDAEMTREQALTKRPPPISAMREDISPIVENYISRLMAKDPTQRYGTVDAAIADLENVKNNKPLNNLIPGKPAPPPRPVRAPSGTLQKMRSGVQGTVGTERGISAVGMRPAKPMGASTGTLQAIKGQTGKVFGRLETHVKSTIPQSETERKGDDYYRQAQLPLALSNWREAFENEVPHAALKIKIELAERELKREAFASALEEAKLRMNVSDYRAAVSRAREALLAAENEPQRQEALQIETEAGRRAIAARNAANIKLVVATIVVVAALILIFIVFKPSPTTDEAEGSDETTPKVSVKGNKDGRVAIAAAGASIVRPPGWIGDGVSLRYDAGGERPVTMQFSKLGKNQSIEQKRTELKEGKGMPTATVVSSLDGFAFVDATYAVSEVVYRYERDSTPYLHFYYLIQGPDETLFQVEFDGAESNLDLALQAQVRGIIQSWTYSRK